MRFKQCGWALILSVTTSLAAAAASLSENAQVSLAGAGRFAELAQGMEATVQANPNRVTDWYSLCYAYSKIKQYARISGCIDRLEQVLKASRDKRTRLFALDDATGAAFLLRAEYLLELADYNAAMQSARQGITWSLREDSDDKNILMDLLAVQALAQVQLGDRDGARQTLDVLEKMSLGILLTDFMSARAMALARVNMALGNWRQVLDSLQSDNTLALRSFLDNLASGAFLRGEDNWVWIAVPRAYMRMKALLELGNMDEARTGLDRLLKHPAIRSNTEIYWMALSDRARIAEADRAPELAMKLYLEAATLIESRRRTIHSEANKIGYIGDKQQVYRKLIALQFASSQFDAVVETMSRSKSRALVDLLASRDASALAARPGVLPEVRQALSQFDDSELAARLQGGSAADAAAAAPLFLGELNELLHPRLTSVPDLRKNMTASDSLLVYFDVGDALYAAAITSDTLQVVRLNVKNLGDRVAAARVALQERKPQAAALMQQLGMDIFEPVRPYLRGERLTVVPHGALHYLPFAALSNTANRAVIDDFSLRQLPSLDVLRYVKPRRVEKVERLLVLGNPDLGNSRYDLPFAQIESEKLGAAFQGDIRVRKKASRQVFLAQAPGASFIHIASHGEFDSARPLQSGLMLVDEAAGGTVASGLLSTADVYGLKLDADVVTLSACETGLGRIENGDDVIGLTRGFLYAGARSVFASLWLVDDEATSELMLTLYQNLGASSRAEALRQAQLKLRARHPHPFYWASFFLTGED